MYERFAQLLAERNVTAYQVAKATGVNSATLSGWKSGAYTPKIDKLQKLAEFFGVPVTEFLPAPAAAAKGA